MQSREGTRGLLSLMRELLCSSLALLPIPGGEALDVFPYLLGFTRHAALGRSVDFEGADVLSFGFVVASAFAEDVGKVDAGVGKGDFGANSL